MSVLRRIAQGWRHATRDRIALVHEWRCRALATMCERSLRDIGITRYDAYFEARKPFWRE